MTVARGEHARGRRMRAWRTLLAGAALVVGTATVLQGQKPEAKRESGIYLESSETGGKDEPKQLEMAMPQMETAGVGASMATMGFKKPKMITKLGGDKAALRVPAQSTFLFVFGKQRSRSEMMENPLAGMNGLPPNTSSPKDYALVVLAPVESDRVYNSSGGKQVKCAVENVEPKVFRIRPEAPLPPGEYAFAWMQGGAAGMLWDFGVDAPAGAAAAK